MLGQRRHCDSSDRLEGTFRANLFEILGVFAGDCLAGRDGHLPLLVLLHHGHRFESAESRTASISILSGRQGWEATILLDLEIELGEAPSKCEELFSTRKVEPLLQRYILLSGLRRQLIDLKPGGIGLDFLFPGHGVHRCMLLIYRLKHRFHAQWLEGHLSMLEINLLAVEYFLRHAIRHISFHLLRPIGIIFTITRNQVLIQHLWQRSIHEVLFTLFCGFFRWGFFRWISPSRLFRGDLLVHCIVDVHIYVILNICRASTSLKIINTRTTIFIILRLCCQSGLLLVSDGLEPGLSPLLRKSFLVLLFCILLLAHVVAQADGVIVLAFEYGLGLSRFLFAKLHFVLITHFS